MQLRRQDNTIRFKEYIQTCYEHLYSTQNNEGEKSNPYYTHFPTITIEVAKKTRYALFIDSVSTNCDLFVDTLPAFRPAKVA